MEKIITFINRYVLALVLCFIVLGFIFAVVMAVEALSFTSDGHWHTTTVHPLK